MRRVLPVARTGLMFGLVGGLAVTGAAVMSPAQAVDLLNTPPTAAASATPNPAHAGDTVTLLGSGSSDKQTATENLTYAWSFGDGSPATGASSANIAVDHVYADPGVYTAALTVTDPQGAADTEQIVINVDDTAPVAHATATPSPAMVQQAVAFDASGTTDQETADSGLTFAWTFGDGKTGAGVAPTHTYTAAGTYAVTMTVTDPQGVSDSVTLSLQVTNTAPVAAGTITPSAPTAGESVAFDGTASTDKETPRSLTYAWDFGDGSAKATTAAPAHTYAAAGTYPVKLTVTDPQGLSSTKSFSLAVGANQNPSATLTASQTRANVGQQISFDGSTSTDRETAKEKLTYAWNFGDGTDTAAITTATTSHAFATAGTYPVTLTVTDANGKTGTATVSITVGNSAPTVAATVTPQPAYALQQVTFDGSASSDAETPGKLLYSWTFGDGTAATAYDANPVATHAYAAAGAHTATLRVKDPVGAVSLKTFSVSVLPNAAPDAKASARPAPAHPGKPVTFDGTGSTDADGDALTYLWEFPDGTTATTATATRTFASLGTRTVSLTVTDIRGVSDTTSVDVVVANAAPTASATASPTTAHVGQQVSFAATGSTDPDGDSLSYLWEFPDGTTATTATTTRTWTATGTYGVKLRVSDAWGGAASTVVSVTVVNDKPVAAFAVSSGFKTTSSTVTFDAAASHDAETPDGLSYQWTVDGAPAGSGELLSRRFTTPGDHMVALTVTDPQGASSLQTRSLAVALPVACESGRVVRTRTWKVVPGGAGGEHCRNTLAGKGRMTVLTSGTRVGLTFGRVQGGGKADVYVDGVRVGSVRSASTSTKIAWNGRKVFAGLAPGDHTVTVRVVRGKVRVDDLLVYGPVR